MDSSSLVNGDLGGYTYCGARKLFAQLDGKPAFEVTPTTQTLQFNNGTFSVQTSDSTMVGIHTIVLWFALANQPLVISSTVTLNLEILSADCTFATLVTS